MTPEDLRLRNRLSNLRGQIQKRMNALEARADEYARQGRHEAALGVGVHRQGVREAQAMVDRMIARLEGRKP